MSSPLHLAVLRLVLGLWLAWHHLRLWPHAAELYSAQGLLPSADAAPWILLPTPLSVLDQPWHARAFVAVNALLGLTLASGLARRPVALSCWYGLAAGAARNPFSFNLSYNYLGWILLALALIPPGEGLTPGGLRPRPGFVVPPLLQRGLWAILGLSYTVSGLSKLGLPEWVEGRAVPLLVASAMGREGPASAALLALPEGVLAALTWSVLALELLYLPLMALPRARPWGWAAMVALHAGIAATTRITELNLAMILVHAFAFDVTWWPGRAQKRV